MGIGPPRVKDVLRGVHKVGFTLFTTVVWLWGCGFVVFESYVSFLKPSPFLPPLDALVVFTGGQGRVETALQLFKKGYAPHLLISGVRSSRQQVLSQEASDTAIDLGYAARNTRGNVEETAMWLKEKHAHTALLITTNYHIPRCLALLEKRAPEMHFDVYPLRDAAPSRLYRTFLEYHKFLITFFSQ